MASDRLKPSGGPHMKKSIAFFAALFLTFSVPTIPVVPAQMSVPVATPMPGAITPSALDRIGVVAAAGGKVELTTPGQVGRIAQSGQAIFMGDEVKTDLQGHLQILLLDETVFTIGPNSTLIIDKFVYDPKSHKGEIKASITKGVFRYVSGKIAAKNPDSVKVKLPTVSIGFRGTIVGGSVDASGQGIVALLGPGDNNDAGVQTGSFTATGTGGGPQEVNRTGFGVETGADGGVSNVFQLSDAQIGGLTQGLGGGQSGGNQGGAGNQAGGSNQGGGQGGPGGNQVGAGGEQGSALGGDPNMGALSGENKVIVGNNVMFMGGINNINNALNAVSVLGAQNARNESGGGAVPNGQTTYEQLRAAPRAPLGPYHYSGSTTYAGGSATVYGQIDITFGQGGQIGTGNSYVEISQTGRAYSASTSFYTDPKGFTGSGPASFSWSDSSSGHWNLTVDVTLSNGGGDVASQATAVVKLVNTESPSPTDYPDSTPAGGATITGTISSGPS